MSETQLKNHIISLSESVDFEDAVKEWRWVGVTYDPNWNKCPCSQSIKEICHIENTKNGNKTHLGNNCIKKFLGIKTGGIFNLLKKFTENTEMIIPMKLINYADQLGYLYPREIEFLHSLWKKKIDTYRLSEKQRNWRDKIVWRILNQVQPQK